MVDRRARRQRPSRPRLCRRNRRDRPLDADQPADRVAERLAASSYATPTGWKFFGTLLDAGQVTICGEESAGTGSSHVREKDGLWAVLLWLDIIAARDRSVAEIVRQHWAEHGRDYYTRHDYEEVDTQAAGEQMDSLRGRLDDLAGERHL